MKQSKGCLRGVNTEYFVALSRELDFAKQQQVAIKLQRLDVKSEKQYTWWAIVSLLQQAQAVAAGMFLVPTY